MLCYKAIDNWNSKELVKFDRLSQKNLKPLKSLPLGKERIIWVAVRRILQETETSNTFKSMVS